MTRSMTGFGKADGSFGGQFIVVEVAAVNHRYLDMSTRIPNGWAALEPEIKQFLRNAVSRGKLCVTISRKRAPGEGAKIRFDAETARQYVDASKELTSLLGGYENLSVNVLAQLEGVFIQEEPEEDLEAVKECLLGIIGEALARLDTMRANEGAALAVDIRERVQLIRNSLSAIEARLPDLNAQHEARLRARIQELAVDLSLTEERIAIEVALLAEKADVTEEVVRLKTHLEHLEELMGSAEPVGRRVDFLLQEIQREINTLGVKTRDCDVSKDVLTMKAELEKVREQVQNIE